MSLDAPDYAPAIARPTAPGWHGLRRAAMQLDHTIGMVCEAIGAMLVLAEVTILFSGVVSRYVFDSPIFWTDELANFLFLWLSMLGMVVALRGDAHMRLTTLANWVPEHWARWFAAVGYRLDHSIITSSCARRRSRLSPGIRSMTTPAGTVRAAPRYQFEILDWCPSYTRWQRIFR